MCRRLAYSGSPVLLEDLLYKPENSLVVQSRHSRLGVETINGDGFGVGWYGAQETPGIYHSTEPAWNDRNLQELSAHAVAGRVFAHIRASTGTAVQQTNCHPFRHGRWLWMHNGAIADFTLLKRDLILAVDPALYTEIEGPTDSELFFFLALTFGLEKDPPEAVARAVGLIEETGRRYGVQHPIRMTIATLRLQYPDNPVLHELSEDARLVVSEPLGDLHGAWREVPESTWLAVQGGSEELHGFSPTPALG